MVNCSSFGIRPSTNDSVHQNFVRDIEKDEAICDGSTFLQSFGLGLSAREAIQQPTIGLAILLIKTIFDLKYSNEERVRTHKVYANSCPCPNIRLVTYHSNDNFVGD